MKKILRIALLLAIAAMVVFAYLDYKRLLAINTTMGQNQTRVLYIPTGATFQDVTDSLQSKGILKNMNTFKWVAKKKSYPSLVKPGRYELRGHLTNNELVNKLRSGDQDPMHLTLHNISGIYQLAGQLGRKLEPDSISFLDLFNSKDALSAFGVDPNTLTAYFLPNTYEVWWDTSPTAFLRRMRQEFDRFWTEERLAKAKKLKLSPIEVVTLASIVESETVRNDEKPTVAGLYLNRLERGMRLQSDPTVIYALKRDDPKVKIPRVYYRHLSYESPFNTYQNAGLPPGPIKIPTHSSIEAVLNPASHNYVYMAADPDRPGYHSFASNLRQHNVNARKYREWAKPVWNITAWESIACL
ncbi:MAG: endolytic transglycosylase MltG [Owenweeksia sp.]|nr:endolytic transglycosylase MltG [Owenweeksia sp.]